MTQRAAQATAPVYFVQQTLKGVVAFGYFASLQGRRQCHSPPQDGNGAVPGAGLQAFIDVRLKPDADSRSFLAWAQDNPAVRDAVHVTGPYDYLLNVRVRHAGTRRTAPPAQDRVGRPADTDPARPPLSGFGPRAVAGPTGEPTLEGQCRSPSSARSAP
ncbi:Lrp/AsnC ligand binding domain-containing protein [Arthrobacter koreensis]|uniref:Lrp/AsnC ligand binding domain-containing protein n=1 Tax=Arthrobacter koreensis TaxID=199136 RepID=UPI0037F44B77